jgi:amino acid permease
MKYSKWIGLAAAIALIISCFLPWAYYPDLDKVFTGFFSEKNVYGRPGKVFIFFAVAAIVLFLVPRVWAKRLNMLICALILAFAVKTYILFTSCYRGTCPDKKEGLYILVISSLIILIASVLPDLKLKKD